MSRPALLVVTASREDFPAGAPAPDALILHVVAGLGGAWTELRGAREHVLFGYPADSREPWFRVLEVPAGGGHNALTLALERIIFARGIREVAVADRELEALVRHGARVHEVSRWHTAPEGVERAEFLRRLADAAVGAA